LETHPGFLIQIPPQNTSGNGGKTSRKDINPYKKPQIHSHIRIFVTILACPRVWGIKICLPEP
jgi:hypothetical protein